MYKYCVCVCFFLYAMRNCGLLSMHHVLDAMHLFMPRVFVGASSKCKVCKYDIKYNTVLLFILQVKCLVTAKNAS